MRSKNFGLKKPYLQTTKILYKNTADIGIIMITGKDLIDFK